MRAFFTILAAAVTIFVLIVVGTQIVSCVQDKQKSDDIATSNTAIDCTVKFETQEYNETETLVYATIFIKNIGKTTVTTFDIQAVFVDGNGKELRWLGNRIGYIVDKYPQTGGFVLTGNDGNETGEKPYELKTDQQAKLGKIHVRVENEQMDGLLLGVKTTQINNNDGVTQLNKKFDFRGAGTYTDAAATTTLPVALLPSRTKQAI